MPKCKDSILNKRAMMEDRVPMLTSRDRTAPRVIAELAYEEYARQHGDSQSFERICERGGLSDIEIMGFLYDVISDLSDRPQQALRSCVYLSANDPEPSIGTVVQDGCNGYLWEHVESDWPDHHYWICDEEQDPESWVKIAGNYGPVEVIRYPGEIVHRCPPVGEHVTPCCGRSPFELMDSRITLNDDMVTCGTTSGCSHD